MAKETKLIPRLMEKDFKETERVAGFFCLLHYRAVSGSISEYYSTRYYRREWNRLKVCLPVFFLKKSLFH